MPGVLLMAAMLGGCDQARGDVEEVVPMARPALYTELDSRVTEIEQAASRHPTATGTPPFPVTFRYDHDQDRHLLIHAQAGYREVSIELWIEDGVDPQHSLLSSRLRGISNSKIAPWSLSASSLFSTSPAACSPRPAVLVPGLTAKSA